MESEKDNPHVSIGTFDQFKIDQASLCNAYRNHIETKITNMERSIRWSIFVSGAVMTTFLSLLSWYLTLIR